MDHTIGAHFEVQCSALPTEGEPTAIREATIILAMAAAMFGGQPNSPEMLAQAATLFRGVKAMIETSRAVGDSIWQ